MNHSAFTRIATTLCASLALTGALAQPTDMTPKPASAPTVAAQAKMQASLPADNGQDNEFATRGFIATPKNTKIRNKDGQLVWDIEKMDWIKGAAPPTVNPSLWRQMKLLKEHGLYKIAEGVWQIRGFDMSNMEIVSGKTGWIVIDPLMTTETAAAAMKFVNEQLGERPVSAVIYGHSHADHFGGVRAVITPGTNPPIYAPEDLVREAASETVLAGNVVSRRVNYQLGLGLPADPRGYVGTGILTATALGGTVSLIPPTDSIKRTGETRVIDGVTFEFQMVPETEAPSEMNFFLPEQRTLYVSEDTTCTLHNVQTPRGALARDANKWAGYITEALNLYGDRAENLVTGHCWPRLGNDVVKNYLALQRDNYKFIHDQTVRLMNRGETPTEIAEEIRIPAAIARQWSNHGYYGSVKHNAKGVYQRYIGWWDGIPAHLDQLPTPDLAAHYVKAMGGATGVLREAKAAMARGEYRWSAQILNDLVFTDPNNKQAKALLADSYEQLGYQAESAIWRNIYLTGADELRGGAPVQFTVGSADVVSVMPMASFLDLVATRLNPAKIGDRAMTMAVDDGSKDNKSLVTLRNSVLVSEVGKSVAEPSVSISGPRSLLMGLFIRKLPLEKMEAAGLKIAGDRQALLSLLDAVEPPPWNYPIVTP